MEHVPLAPFSTLGVGGPARWFGRAMSIEDVLSACTSTDTAMFVLGGGSNLVIADEGFNGLVLQIGIGGIAAVASGGDVIVTAGAGESWDGLVQFAVERDLAGIECLSGIPGTVGGTPIQNVGAYGQDVAAVIEWVHVFDRQQHRTMRLSRDECGFGYRMSRFTQQDADRFIVVEVAFRLRPGGSPTATYPDVMDYLSKAGGGSPTLQDVRTAVLNVRRRKGMVIDAADPDTRSVGSFFMNPVVSAESFERIRRQSPPHYLMDNGTVKIPAAWLIERSGFHCGHADDRVGLSSKHPLAIINRGGATSRDVVRLARRIKTAVIERFGIALRPEPVFVGFGADPDIEFLRG